ncbi:MAG: GTP 3',8-cyclase MoaA [Deltaproteobacteria bacterium]|nr:GTP 3',8-cyclase MoaA [Deltaproteobacteria bacterium]
MSSILTDSFGRTIDYLRISVTDRCNFRCIYCMPPEGIPTLPREEILTFEEIARVARIFLKLGGRRLRITGGEPLLRKNVVELVEQLAGLPKLKDLALTTNGFFLSKLAQPLKDAGLQRINISLDSLDHTQFSKLTKCSKFEDVWEGIEQALTADLKVKINVVIMKGINEKEILRFGGLAKNSSIEVRFIEFMPLCGTGWRPEWVFPIKEVRDLLKENFTLAPIPRGQEVAESYRIENGKGNVGFIASLTEPFCDSCSRLRLTADGKLRSCLFSNAEVELKPWLRGAEPVDEMIERIIIQAVRSKPAGHGMTYPITTKNPEELPKIRFVGG